MLVNLKKLPTTYLSEYEIYDEAFKYGIKIIAEGKLS